MILRLDALKPSETRALSHDLKQGQRVNQFLESVTGYLSEPLQDHGWERDTIFSTATELSSAGIWESISARDLANSVVNSNPDKLAIFLQGLPHVLAAQVAAGREKLPSLAVKDAPGQRWVVKVRHPSRHRNIQNRLATVRRRIAKGTTFDIYRADELWSVVANNVRDRRLQGAIVLKILRSDPTYPIGVVLETNGELKIRALSEGLSMKATQPRVTKHLA